MLSVWKPQNDLFRFARDLDGLFARPTPRSPAVWPAVDIEEKDDRFVLRADLPGMEEKDIEVTVHDGTLTLSGKREAHSDQTTENGTQHERRFGPFQRSFRLGPAVAEQDIKATYKNGELVLELPKREEVRPRQIKVTGK